MRDLTLQSQVVVSTQAGFASAYSLQNRKDRTDVTVLEGRTPQAPDEVAVGPRLLRRLDLEVGGTLRLGGGADGVALRVVGIVLLQDDSVGGLGDNLLVDTSAVTAISTSPPMLGAHVTTTSDEAEESFGRTYGPLLELETAFEPREVVNVTGLRALPTALVALLLVLALAALLHNLLLQVRRRGRDLAVLRALGGTAVQRAGSLAVAACLVVATGLALGVPAGLLLGRLLWAETAYRVGVAGDIAVPTGTLVLLVLGSLASALLLAVLVASWSGRRGAASRLREE